MTKEELIIKTENHIKNIPHFKEQISKINKNIEEYQIEINNIQDKINMLERNKTTFERQIQKLKNSMEPLTEEEQKIICYKYFENICNAKIGSLMGYSSGFCNKSKIRKILYDIGECLFCSEIMQDGLED